MVMTSGRKSAGGQFCYLQNLFYSHLNLLVKANCFVVAASVISINIVCNKACLKVPGIAQRIRAVIGDVKVFRKNKLNALYKYITAAGVVMCWNGNCLHFVGGITLVMVKSGLMT